MEREDWENGWWYSDRMPTNPPMGVVSARIREDGGVSITSWVKGQMGDPFGLVSEVVSLDLVHTGGMGAILRVSYAEGNAEASVYTGVEFFRTDDGGESWVTLGMNGVPNSGHILKVGTISVDKVLRRVDAEDRCGLTLPAITDLGEVRVFVSDDKGDSWREAGRICREEDIGFWYHPLPDLYNRHPGAGEIGVVSNNYIGGFSRITRYEGKVGEPHPYNPIQPWRVDETFTTGGETQ